MLRRQFFETMYSVLIAVLDESFLRLGKKEDIEREVSPPQTDGRHPLLAAMTLAAQVNVLHY